MGCPSIGLMLEKEETNATENGRKVLTRITKLMENEAKEICTLLRVAGRPSTSRM